MTETRYDRRLMALPALAAILLLCMFLTPASASERVALEIGIGAYAHAPALRTPATMPPMSVPSSSVSVSRSRVSRTLAARRSSRLVDGLSSAISFRGAVPDGQPVERSRLARWRPEAVALAGAHNVLRAWRGP